MITIAQSWRPKRNWPEATARLKRVLADQPDRADILYDSGISAYKNSEFDKALAYFNKAGNDTKASQELHEQTYFNAGNTHVKLKQLHEAIESYDKVLALNPDHEKAKHNKEIVKKMLEQQKKQQEQDKKDEQEKDKEQDKKEENNKEKQEQKDQKESSDSKQQQNKDQSEQQQQEQEKKKKNLQILKIRRTNKNNRKRNFCSKRETKTRKAAIRKTIKPSRNFSR